MDCTAEVFDQFQLLCDVNGFNDHQMHCVLRFEHPPDAEILKKAVISSIEAVHVLGTRYIQDARPRWTSLDPSDFGRAFVIARTEMELEEFLGSRVDERLGPQVRVCLLESSPFAIAFKMNHMVCDATGFKEYLYLLCEIYSGLAADPAYKPAVIAGDRSIRTVLKHFGMSTKLKCLFLQSKENNLTGRNRFPLGTGGEVRPFILTRKLGREKTTALKNYGRARGATLNDVVLTAYYRCLFQRLAVNPDAKLQIPVMVDMRRYLKEAGKFTSLTNLASTAITQLEYRPEERFKGTLARVKAIMDKKKRSNIGLNAFIKLHMMYRIFGDRIANYLLRTSLKNPLICMTNVGMLDSAQISFGGLRPHDAFLCGSIKYKPYFQLAMSSYEGEITLSVNLWGSASDRNRILSFLDEIDAELHGCNLAVHGATHTAMQSQPTISLEVLPKIPGSRHRRSSTCPPRTFFSAAPILLYTEYSRP
jgi:NRPS condensation-like uncharacterized protein